MDPTVVGAILTAAGGIVGAIIPVFGSRIRKRRRTAKGIATGTVEDLIVPVTASHALRTFGSLLADARTVRMAGWSLIQVISETRRSLRDLVGSGATLKILLLDPGSAAVAILDRNVSELDWRIRKADGWRSVGAASIAGNDIRRSLEILDANGLLRTKSNDIVCLCTSLLPFGLLMVEGRDGSGWLSVQMYPLHPDMEFRHRLCFAVGSRQSPLWELFEEQFDAAWDDRNYSISAAPAPAPRGAAADSPPGTLSPPPG